MLVQCSQFSWSQLFPRLLRGRLIVGHECSDSDDYDGYQLCQWISYAFIGCLEGENALEVASNSGLIDLCGVQDILYAACYVEVCLAWLRRSFAWRFSMLLCRARVWTDYFQLQLQEEWWLTDCSESVPTACTSAWQALSIENAKATIPRIMERYDGSSPPENL